MHEKLINSCSIMSENVDTETHFTEQENAVSAINFEQGYIGYIKPVNTPHGGHVRHVQNVRSYWDVYDIIEGCDYKNGMDLYKVEDGYKFRVYGQSFSRDGGETWETITEDVYIVRSNGYIVTAF